MAVFECRGCPGGVICNLFIQDDDCEDPQKCPWVENGNVPVWRRLGVVG